MPNTNMGKLIHFQDISLDCASIPLRGKWYCFKGDTVKIVFPFRKEVFSIRKEFAPLWIKFFSFSADPFFRKGLVYRKANRKSQKSKVVTLVIALDTLFLSTKKY